MAKTASRTHISAPVKKVPQTAHDPHADATEAESVPEPVDQECLVTMTQDEGLQVYEARCMLQLLEDMAILGEREITISRESLVVMMAVIREKLAFTERLIPADDEDVFEDRE